METTMVQLKKTTALRLQKLKRYGRQSYDEVINTLIDNPDELTVDDIEAIKAGIADIKAGRFYTEEQIIKRHGLKID